MPTIFTHPIVPLAIALGAGQKIVSRPLLLAGVIASLVPDLDVLAFRFGIPYANAFGHRGFSHSLLFAVILALLGACFYKWLKASPIKAFVFLFAVTLSHSILDAFTTGGLGVAFLWPWSETRFFAPIQMIRVSPFSPAQFMSARGVAVLRSEFFWVWLPFFSTALLFFAGRFLSKQRRRA